MLKTTLLTTVVLVTPAFATPTLDGFWLQALNFTTGGRVQPVVPYARSCYPTYHNNIQDMTGTDMALCMERLAKTKDYPGYRRDIFSSFQFDVSQTCRATSETCNWSGTNDTSLYSTSTCSQGNLADYYIDMKPETAENDIRLAYLTSLGSGVPITIKGTGHDFWGRSSGPGSLALWTRHLSDMSYTPAFVPVGAPRGTAGTPVMTVGAGVVFDDAFAYAHAHDVTFLGGSCVTVGASGGWVMGGGVGPLSNTMGMGVDRVVQVKMVTPDGITRYANQYQNADLFWAVRGGGGATYGVVLETTHMVDPKKTISAVQLLFSAAQPNSQREFFEIVFNNILAWSDKGWGGYLFGSGMIFVNDRLDATAAAASLAPLFTWASSKPAGYILTGPPAIKTFTSYFDLQYQMLNPVSVGSDPGTGGSAVAGRLLQERNFNTPAARNATLNAMLTFLAGIAGNPANGFVAHVAGPRVFHKEHPLAWNTTSLHPAWRTGVMHVESQRRFQWNDSNASLQATYTASHDSVKVFKAITPDTATEQGGSYMNESDMYATDFKKDYFGSNYAKLLTIKAKYDPLSILKPVWQGVGWNGAASSDKYKCYLPSTASS